MPADPDNAASSAGASALPLTAPAPPEPELDTSETGNEPADEAHEPTDRDQARGRATARTAPPASRIARSRALTSFHALAGALILLAVALGAWPALIAAAALLADIVIRVRTGRAARHRTVPYTAPDTSEVTVVRDGGHHLVPPGDLTPGDIVDLEPGAPVVADGVVLAADGLEVDESQLTGAALPVARRRGQSVAAGSFVTAGRGRIETQSTAPTDRRPEQDTRTTGSAPTPSPIRTGIHRLTPGLALLAGALAVAVLVAGAGSGLEVTELRGPAGGLVALVPLGLVLLTTLACARAARELHGHRVVVRDPDVVSGLAGVDVLCIDKTGTLTEPVLDVVHLQLVRPADDSDRTANGTEDAAEVRRVLGAIAWTDPQPDVTSSALAAAFPAPQWTPTVVHPFSLGRRAAAIGFTEHGHWLLGAPDVVLPTTGTTAEAQAAAALVEAAVRAGRRVLLLARTHDPVPDHPLTSVPAATPVAAVTFEERLRPDAARTLTGLRQRSVDIKVVSGDDTRIVAGVAARLDLPGTDSPVDGRRLPRTGTDPKVFADTVEDRTVFGNLDPGQKQAVVAALRRRGHRVAMVGDGINDLPALAEADLGVALGSGSPAARAAVPVILAGSRLAPLLTLRDRSEHLLGTVERLSDLFLTKTVGAALLILAVGAAGMTMPLEPAHVVLVALLGLVAPAAALVLQDRHGPTGAPGSSGAHDGTEDTVAGSDTEDTSSTTDAEPTGPAGPSGGSRTGADLLERPLRFALPAGAVATAAVFASYTLADDTVAASGAGASTSAALTLFLVLLWLAVALLRSGEPSPGVPAPRAVWVTVPAALAAAFAVALLLPPLRDLFDLEVDGALVLLSGVGVAAIAGVALEVAWQTSGWDRRTRRR